MPRPYTLSPEAKAAIQTAAQERAARATELERFKENGTDDLHEAWISLMVRANDGGKRVVQDKLAHVIEAIGNGIWRNPETGDKYDLGMICAQVQEQYQLGVRKAQDFDRIKLKQIADRLGLSGGTAEPGKLIQPKKNVDDFYIESIVYDGKIYACPRQLYQVPSVMGKKLAGDIKKNNLPGAIFAGVFNLQRKANDWLQSTGLYVLDFDTLANMDAAVRMIAADLCVAFLYKSPTLTGCKPVVRGPKVNTPEEYKAVYERIVQYAKEAWGLTANFDSDTSDCSRLSFLNHDKNVYYNWDAVPLSIKLSDSVPSQPTPALPITPPEPVTVTTSTTENALDSMPKPSSRDEAGDEANTSADDWLEAKKQIAEDILGKIEWNGDQGICICPGKGLHENPSKDETDCTVFLNHQSTEDRPATISCFHKSCSKQDDPDSPVVKANHELRSRIAKLKIERGSTVKVNRPDAATGKPAPRELPPIQDCFDLLAEKLAMPAELVKGLIHQGTKVVLGGGSKSRKTFDLIDLAVSVATGIPWWGSDTIKGRVLYINFEIPKVFFQDRVKKICEAKNLTLEKGMIDHWCLRGYANDAVVLCNQILRKLKANNSVYALIIIDPVYKMLGDKNENAAGDVAYVLNELEVLCVETLAAVVFGAHHSKGNQSAKEAIDCISGSGVFARDPDTMIILREHETPNAYTVDTILRNFPPMEPFVVRWKYPLMTRDGDLDPRKLKQKDGCPPHKEERKMLWLRIAGKRMKSGELLMLALEDGISERSYYRILNEFKAQKKVIKEGHYLVGLKSLEEDENEAAKSTPK